MSGPPTFTQAYTVRTPGEQSAYFIPERDLKRLESHIRRIVSPTNYFQIAGTFFLSVFVSAIFALLGFRTAQQLPDWLIPTTWTILLGSFILGISLLVLDTRDKKIVVSSIDSAINELNDIKENCKQNPDEPQEHS